jgi:hypothetical protein
VFQVGLAWLRFRSGNTDVMVPAHGFSLSVLPLPLTEFPILRG